MLTDVARTGKYMKPEAVQNLVILQHWFVQNKMYRYFQVFAVFLRAWSNFGVFYDQLDSRGNQLLQDIQEETR